MLRRVTEVAPDNGRQASRPEPLLGSSGKAGQAGQAIQDP